MPASTSSLSKYQTAQANDPLCSQVIAFCRDGWPEKRQIPSQFRPYWDARSKLTVVNNLLLYTTRLVVPSSLQEEALTKIHQGHLGIQKCLLRANSSIWWPGIAKQVRELVHNCQECAQHSTLRWEPLIPATLPQYPWQELGADIFMLDGTSYLLVVDYFSCYLEVIRLTSTTSSSVITGFKSVFSRHGIQEVLQTDNGPQFSSEEMSSFATAYEFQHRLSSPHFPQSNGQAERAVQTVKRLLKKSPSDPYQALLVYRSTPLHWCGYSPAQLLMGRQLRTTLPLQQQKLVPDWSYLDQFCQQDKMFKQRQKQGYDTHHHTCPLPELSEQTPVLVQTGRRRVPGTVTAQAPSPRSYLVDTTSGQLRRNRHHLIPVPINPSPSLEHHSDHQSFGSASQEAST